MKQLSFQLKALVVILLSIVLVSACSDSKKEAETKADEKVYTNNDLLVTISWLEENLDKEDVLIIDARGEEEYLKGHIPGAIPVRWQQFSDVNGSPGDEGWGVVLDAATLSERLSEIGVSNDKTVVVYGNPNSWGEDGRILWTLSLAGIKGKMLDGGWTAWQASKEISKEATEVAASDFNVSELDLTMFASTEWLNENYERLVVIDSRTEKEFNGANDMGEARGGHIPGAINIPFKEMYNNDSTIKTQEEIDEMLANLGITKDDAIVTYCTAGIRSAHMALVLKMAGYENVKNYDASFYEWAGNTALPIE